MKKNYIISMVSGQEHYIADITEEEADILISSSMIYTTSTGAMINTKYIESIEESK